MTQLIKLEHLSELIGNELALQWCVYLNEAAEKHEINTTRRAAAWIAQLLVESAKFKALEENLNYSEAGLLRMWPNRFTKRDAIAYAYRPEKIANRVYADRMGNGNEASGDGWKYHGRGLIMVTGKANYKDVSKYLNYDFISRPDDLKLTNFAALSAAWFWDFHGLNQLADQDKIETISKIINGGTNALKERVDTTEKVLKVFSK